MPSMDAQRIRDLDAATIALLEASSWRSDRDELVDCAACGAPFWRHPTSEPAVYCSDTCRSTAYHRRTYGHRATLRGPRHAPARRVHPAALVTGRPREGTPRDKQRWDWEQWR